MAEYVAIMPTRAVQRDDAVDRLAEIVTMRRQLCDEHVTVENQTAHLEDAMLRRLSKRRLVRLEAVVKLELGTKRLCSGCSARFYDLNKDPIVCPKCHTVLELVAASARARPDTTTTAHAIKPAAEEEVVAPEVADAEFVSLEEADAEAQGKMTADGDVIGGAEEAEEEVELQDAGLNDAAFIEEQEEGGEDVTDIIGDVDDKEET
jgi:uncharacterized protein (TIGR02300 family)